MTDKVNLILLPFASLALLVSIPQNGLKGLFSPAITNEPCQTAQIIVKIKGFIKRKLE